MISFKDILEEKIKLKTNKGYSITFNERPDHLLKDKLKRSNITEQDFRYILNSLTKRVKTDKLDDGNYAFIFKKFKITVILRGNEIFITTILTKDMTAKVTDTKVVMESIEYQIIYMESWNESWKRECY